VQVQLVERQVIVQVAAQLLAVPEQLHTRERQCMSERGTGRLAREVLGVTSCHVAENEVPYSTLPAPPRRVHGSGAGAVRTSCLSGVTPLLVSTIFLSSPMVCSYLHRTSTTTGGHCFALRNVTKI
jgi:hypothetical protein